MGVSKNWGTPKWMVKIMENPLKMDDLGVPLFSETSIFTTGFGIHPRWPTGISEAKKAYVFGFKPLPKETIVTNEGSVRIPGCLKL